MVFRFVLIRPFRIGSGVFIGDAARICDIETHTQSWHMGFAEFGESLRSNNRRLKEGIRDRYFRQIRKNALPGVDRRRLPVRRESDANEKRRASIMKSYAVFVCAAILVLMIIAFLSR